jgi:hypothetical protein
MTPGWRALRFGAALAAAACGARTDIDLGASSPLGADASSANPDGPRTDALVRADARADGGSVRDTGATDAIATRDATDGPPPVDDPCPSALLAGAPRAMLRSCSTRDGRARVLGPRNPHLTWTIPGFTPELGYTGLLADESDGVYLVSGNLQEGHGSVTKIAGSTGALDWSFGPLSSQPVLLPAGGPDALAAAEALSLDSSDRLELSEVTLGSGTASATALGYLGGSVGTGAPAVGEDGALYFDVVSTATPSPMALVSRVGADGSVRSTDLTQLLGRPFAAEVDFLPLALAPGDLALGLISVEGQDSPGQSVMAAIDAAGGLAWSKSFGDQVGAGLAVTAAGDVLVLLTPGEFTSASNMPAHLELFDVAGNALRPEATVGAFYAATLFAVLRDGTALIGAQTSEGEVGWDSLYAIGVDGSERWSISDPFIVGVTVDAKGDILVVKYYSLEARDGASGTLLWTLSAPSTSYAIVDATFTSSGGIVAEVGDGSAFGASD